MPNHRQELVVNDECRIARDPGRYHMDFCQTHLLWVKKCLNCGEEFHYARVDTKTCGDKCRKGLSRKLAKTFQMKV